MNKPLWQSKHFKNIFQTVYITSLALLTLSTLIMYAAFRQVSGSYLDSMMIRFMENTYSSIEYQIGTSQNHALNASTSYNGVILFSSQTGFQEEKLRASRDIDYFIVQDSNIHSVLFYNASSNQIFMFGRDLISGDADTFFDEDIVQRIRSSAGSSSQYFPREICNSPYNHTVSQVLTSIKHVGSGNYVVTNLDTTQIFSVLRNSQSVYSQGSINYLVTYGRNQIIYNSAASEELTDWEAAVLKELSNHQWNKSFRATIDHVSYRFHVVEDPENNLQMVSVIRQFDVTASYLTYLLLFICVLLASGMIAALVNVKVSSKLYSPIVRIKHTLSDEENTEAAASSKHSNDEIDDITRQITDRTMRMESLFSYKKKSLSLSQEIFLKNQILYKKYTDEQFWEKCSQEELPYHNGDRFILIYAQWFPAKPDAEEDSGNQELLCFGLSNVVHELIDGRVNVKDLPFEKDGIAFLLCFQDAVSLDTDYPILTSIQRVFDQYFELNLSFFISDTFTKPHELYSAMQQLQDLSGYQFMYERGCILRQGDIDTAKLLLDVCETPDISELEGLVRFFEWDACKQIMDAYFLELHHYTIESARASLNVFVSKLISMFKRIEATCPSFPTLNYHQFYSQVSAVRTLAQAQALIYGQISDMIQVLGEDNHNYTGIDAKDVQRFLENNYQDFSLSSKSVALNFHVSVPYLNRVFKQKTGESISSYLKKLRLEHARTLLMDTNKPVEIIAKNVGFENTKYFYSLFKAEYGISPNNYRTSGKKAPEQ
ncbi:MAG: helix-turn-helix domain-containing protein [Faecousia sp.]